MHHISAINIILQYKTSDDYFISVYFNTLLGVFNKKHPSRSLFSFSNFAKDFVLFYVFIVFSQKSRMIFFFSTLCQHNRLRNRQKSSTLFGPLVLWNYRFVIVSTGFGSRRKCHIATIVKNLSREQNSSKQSLLEYQQNLTRARRRRCIIIACDIEPDANRRITYNIITILCVYTVTFYQLY